jgi:uncharacterized protein
MEDKFYEELKKNIQPYFEEVGGHEFDHTQRVYNLSLQIAKEEKGDIDIIKASALLHDIARKKQDECKNKICHAEEGAKMAGELLEKTDFPKDKISAVCSAIETHRFSKNLKPKTKEAEILQDADRLDALGAIAIGRIFSYGGKNNHSMYNPNLKPQKYEHNYLSETSINHIYEKILELKPETFRTKRAKEIAKERYDFIKQFVDQFIKEWEGKL